MNYSRLSIGNFTNLLQKNYQNHQKQTRNEKTKSCSTLWFDECYDDYYQNSSEKYEKDICDYSASNKLKELNKFDEHRIRIKVNYDTETNENHGISVNYCEPVSRIQIDDSILTGYEDQVSSINIESDSSLGSKSVTSDSISSVSDFQVRLFGYNEKAIDVPAGFEEQAYERIIKHNRSPIKRKICTPIRQLNPLSSDFLEVSIRFIDSSSFELG